MADDTRSDTHNPGQGESTDELSRLTSTIPIDRRPSSPAESDPAATTGEGSEELVNELGDLWALSQYSPRDSFWNDPRLAGIESALRQDKRYVVEETIGEGSYGRVYAAKDTHLGRAAAIKVLRTKDNSGASVAGRFIDEAATVAGLDHPNIVPVYDLDLDSKGNFYIAMKRVAGKSLSDISKEARDGMPAKAIDSPIKVSSIFISLCNAVSLAHSRGVIHLDIKPANVMLGSYGEVILIDWGSAARPGFAGFRGTPMFMAPEQARKERMDERTDIYALGCTLFGALLHRPPLIVDDVEQFWERKHRGEIDLPSKEEAAAVPPPLLAIALKAMSNDPADRYASAEDMAEDLRNYQSDLSVSAFKDSWWDRARRWYKLHRTACNWAATILLMFAVAGAVYFVESARANERIQAAELRHFQEEALARQKKKEEAAALVERGAATLAQADESDDPDGREELLIAAQETLRRALFMDPENERGRERFRAASLAHFELALQQKNWRQAREKLDQAGGAGLAGSEIEAKRAMLKDAESARSREIAEKVNFLLQDAVAATPTVPYQVARQRLIGLNDPVTVKLLLECIRPEAFMQPEFAPTGTPKAVKLALDVLGWIADQGALQEILPYTKVKYGSRFPESLRGKWLDESHRMNAVIAACQLIEDRKDAVDLISEVVRYSPKSKLVDAVSPFVKLLAKRVGDLDPASFEMNELDTMKEADRLVQLGRHEDAEALLTKIIEKGKGGAAAYFLRGAMRHWMSDLPGALADTEKALEYESKRPSLWMNRSIMLGEMGRLEEALKSADKAVEVSPGYGKAYSIRANAKSRIGDWRGAMADLDKAISIDPRHVAAHDYKITILRNRGETLAAIEAAREFVKAQPRIPLPAFLLARCYLDLPALVPARRWFQACIDQDPEGEATVKAPALLARVKSDLGEFDAALADVAALEGRGHSSKELATIKAVSLRQLGRIAQAEKIEAENEIAEEVSKQVDDSTFMRTARTKGPDLANDRDLAEPGALAERAFWYLENVRIDEAIEDLKKAVSLGRDSLTGRPGATLARLLRARRSHKEELGVLRLRAEAKPDSAEDLAAYARRLLDTSDEGLRDPATALKMALEASRFAAESDAGILDTLALAYYENGDYAKAVGTQKKAVSLLDPAQQKSTSHQYKYRLRKYKRALDAADDRE
jgi:tetratricopeptide (TPR) repeat protein